MKKAEALELQSVTPNDCNERAMPNEQVVEVTNLLSTTHGIPQQVALVACCLKK